MTTPHLDAHVRLDTHPTHPSAVTATLTGANRLVAHLALEAADWTTVADNTLVLARIDHEEPHWAKDAAQHLSDSGITVEITPRLQKAMDEEWTWAEYPMPWCTRSEIREVSDQAQKIHDDIRRGQLLIHAHADDGNTTAAVGTYLHGGESVHLHGEDHLRQVAGTFDSPGQALLAFEKAHGTGIRPGPAPLTATEHAAIEARTPLSAPPKPEPTPALPEAVPVYLADPGDHDAALELFLDTHKDWRKWRTWSDDTTHAVHENQTLRIERVHESDPREYAWTIAAYENPVSDRIWHMTLTGTTPAPLLQTLLDNLAETDVWETSVGTPVTEKTVTQATRALTDAGWQHTLDGRWIRWRNHDGDAGVQFDAFAAQRTYNTLPTWTLWAGSDITHPHWAIHASPYTPAPLLARLTEELAHGSGTRQPAPSPHRQTHRHAAQPAAAIPAPSPRPARHR
ncbi:DUF317 domain-containing protein [Streptomyces sp. SCSIO 30461]|uniref:DUF317 domain-containing protein n=1 Tax=Streptomyces sp. SCSIO 30461 TaxID=3118085 RepID=UPI0030D2D7E0